MTNRLALILGGLIAVLIAANVALGWQAHVVLGKILVDIIEWLAFWR